MDDRLGPLQGDLFPRREPELSAFAPDRHRSVVARTGPSLEIRRTWYTGGRLGDENVSPSAGGNAEHDQQGFQKSSKLTTVHGHTIPNAARSDQRQPSP